MTIYTRFLALSIYKVLLVTIYQWFSLGHLKSSLERSTMFLYNDYNIILSFTKVSNNVARGGTRGMVEIKLREGKVRGNQIKELDVIVLCLPGDGLTNANSLLQQI
jgi:hypothetical protein